MNTVTWVIARAGGLTAYVLLTLSVVLGVGNSMGWKSKRWPKLFTYEMHNFLTTLSLVFVGVHTFALLVDPFEKFHLAEMLVPFTTHYRAVWTGLGITAIYLMLAVWISTKLQRRIGRRLWRAIHYLSYAVYGLATLHGIGSGTDSSNRLVMLMYVASIAAVGGVTAARMMSAKGARPARPRAALAAVALAAFLVAFAARAPFRPPSRVATTTTAPVAAAPAAGPFRADANGTISLQRSGSGEEEDGGSMLLRIDLRLSNGPFDAMLVQANAFQDDGALHIGGSRFVLRANDGTTCSGTIGTWQGWSLAGTCSDGTQVRADLNADPGGSVTGTVQAMSAGGGTPGAAA